jgi:hypothetical protein
MPKIFCFSKVLDDFLQKSAKNITRSRPIVKRKLGTLLMDEDQTKKPLHGAQQGFFVSHTEKVPIMPAFPLRAPHFPARHV